MLVYIREAHAIDSELPMEFGMIEDPVTDRGRHALAERCTTELGLTMPALVDGIDDAVNRRWHAWPERLYLINADGTVAYAGGPGPFEFHPDELETAIRAVLDPEGAPSTGG